MFIEVFEFGYEDHLYLTSTYVMAMESIVIIIMILLDVVTVHVNSRIIGLVGYF